MKITIYTINDCVFSKQEKDYLVANKLAFEEKNLETNKEFLTEMLAVSNNFAGTPVTKIEKDDGQIVILKGFTLEEFNKTLGLTPTTDTSVDTTPKVEETHVDMQSPVSPVAPQTNDPLPPLDIPAPVAPTDLPQPPVVPAPVMPVTSATTLTVSEPPVIPPTEPVPPAQPTVPAAPVAPQTGPSNDQLNSILSDLQNKVNQPDLNPPPAPVIPNPDLGKTN